MKLHIYRVSRYSITKTDNEMLFKLKEMEYIERIAEKVGEVTVSNGGQVVDQLTQLFSK